jgi:hypothetical protein
MSIWLAAVLALGLASAPLAATTPDRPETGKQGETIAGETGQILPVPYSKGVDVVGHTDIGGRTGNLIMTWSGRCAYVADGMTIKPDGQLAKVPVTATSGVAVIDVRDPSKPKTVKYLQDKGAIYATETLNASTSRSRAVLAASTYGGVAGINGPPEGWLSVYDVTTCASPLLKSEVKWPEPTHTITVSPDGRYVYGTVINPFTGAGGIEVMDISDMTKPRFVGKFAATRPDGSSFAFAPHELMFNADGTRIYVGVIGSQGADAEHEFKVRPGASLSESVGREAGGLFIFDNSDFVANKPDPKLRLIGSLAHAGWHSPAQARIGGVPYIINAGELGACPGAWPRFTSIADERHPRNAGEFRLAMNHAENCPEPTPMEKASGGAVGRAGIASTHFQDVDDANNTRLGLFSFMYAGLRIVDLRDPKHPTEIAYFKPGDPCMSHVRYDRLTRTVWFACNASGFWTIALKPELTKKLGLR